MVRRILGSLIMAAGFLAPCLTWPNGDLWGGFPAAIIIIGSIGAGLILGSLVMADD